MSRPRSTAVGAVIAAAATAAITVAATLVAVSLAAAPANAQASGTGTGYLRTNGNRIVDSTGATVRLTGINWFGMETDNHTFHGLWANAPATWRGQIDKMADLGFNTLRIPYTGDSLRPNAQATGINDFTNPDLVGLHPLEILDLVIEHAGSRGMRVILDRHRPSAASGITALWYTPQVSEQSIINDWVMLAQRYAGNTTVVGADLINEPHAEGTLPNATGSGWGTGGTARDWRLAAERIGNAILAVQPNWLILVEGVSCPTGGLPNPWSNPPIDDDCTWWGGNLAAAGQFPVRLNVANRLVYSAHDYAISVFDRQPWFDDPNFPNNLPSVWDHYWGYLHKQNIAPVLVGEFGTTLQHPLDRQWLPALMSYLTANGMSFTFWSWNPNSGDTGGLVLDDWWTVNETKYNILAPHLVPPDGTGPGPSTPPSTGTPPTTSPPPAGGDCAVTYALTGGWPGNFQADVTVRNTGTSTINGWTVGWLYGGNQNIYNSWGVDIDQSGANVSGTNVGYNATIPPGQSVTFGLQGTVTGTNAVPSPISCSA
jgi:endoglucanase